MFAIVAGPLPVPDGTSPAEYEAGHAKRDPTVVASEAGCMMYQLVKTSQGDYYMLELYKDQEALDTHFKNMGQKKGAPPLEKLKPDGMLKIFPVVSAIVRQDGVGSIANVVRVPVKDGPAFAAASSPALVEFDRDEPGTCAYIMAKSLDGQTYFFLEIFQDQEALMFHLKGDTFKAMGKSQKPALKGAPGGKPDMSLLGWMAMCGNTPRKTVAATPAARL